MARERKKSLKIYIKTVVFSFNISFKASPVIMMFRLITLFVEAFIPTINMLSIKNIVDYLISTNSKKVFFWFGILAITQIGTTIIGKLNDYFSNIHSDKISLAITKDIINKINQLDISYFDNPKMYDEIINVTRDIGSIPSLIWNILSTIQLFIKFVTAAIVLFEFSWWAPLCICITCVPNFVFDKKYALKLYYWTRDSVNEVRKMNYSYEILTSKAFCKDIRINSLFNFLKEKYEKQWLNWYSEKKKILDKQFIASFITVFFTNIVMLFFLLIVIKRISAGEGLIGDVTYYIGMVGQLTTATFGIISTFSDIVQQNVKIGYYDNFKKWKSTLKSESDNLIIDTFESLEFINVSFKYPNTDHYVLKNISFKINKGEKVGIVGKNGCGKSTIVKLILYFYKPTEGCIKINGKDTSNIEITEYYKLLSIMLQDYINYSFTLKENIITTDINSYCDDASIIDACKKSNAYEFVEKWENGIESYLTKNFDINGKELSGGQWQKLAIARFFYKKAQVYIMDEPSASLDIESENIIFTNVFEQSLNSTLILISHSLSNLRLMDKIIVLDEGYISEIGSHDELVNKGGIYSHLYKIQKQKM